MKIILINRPKFGCVELLPRTLSFEGWFINYFARSLVPPLSFEGR
ncbi:MAG: hypothetical protein ACTS4X_01140 [Candidatus Hodgkinia cicadicola]